VESELITTAKDPADIPIISSSLKFAWDTTWQRFFSLLAVMLVVTGVPMAITFRMDDWLRVVIVQVYGSFLLGGMWLMFISVAEGSRFRFQTLFSRPLQFWKFIVVNILNYVIVIAGLILLVVPGVMWAVQFGVVQQVLADENVGPIEAFKRSSQLTKGHRMKLFVWFLACLAIIFVASLVAGIAAAPFSLMAKTFDVDFKDAIKITVTLMMMPLMAFFYLAWSHVYFQLHEASEARTTREAQPTQHTDEQP